MDGKTASAEILTTVEAAAMLKISRGGLYNLVSRGEIPHIRLFGRRSLRFRREDIEKLLEPGNGTSRNK